MGDSWNIAELTMVIEYRMGSSDGIEGGGEIVNCNKEDIMDGVIGKLEILEKPDECVDDSYCIN